MMSEDVKKTSLRIQEHPLDSIGHKGDTKEMGHFMDGLDCKKQRAQDYTGISSLKMRVTSLGN